MTSFPEHAPSSHSQTCAECKSDILTMAYRGTGVCGQVCLASWRKKHPLPEELQVTKDEFLIAVSNLHVSQRNAEHIWKVLNGLDA